MAQENSYNRHRLIIEGREILSSSSGSIKFTGNNRLNTLDVTINNPDLQESSLLHNKVELYLNESGSESNIPIFRGFIKEFSMNEKDTRIRAVDVRTVLTGREGTKVTLNDEMNADGKTVAQYLFQVINDEINYDITVIGLDMLRDSEPVSLMRGVRGDNIDFYDTIKSVINKTIDDSDILTPLSSFIDVYEGVNDSNIVIVKDKSIDSIPSYTFSYNDGISQLMYKKRQPANTVFYKNRSTKYTNRPTGQIAIEIESLEDIGDSRNLALNQILISQQQNYEISMVVTKAYDIALGSIVNLDVPEEVINGSHRVQSKTISFGNTISCSLELNKKPIILSDYIS